MSGGSYSGGSTVIHGGSGWFAKDAPAEKKSAKEIKRDARKKAAENAARKRFAAAQRAARLASAPSPLPTTSALATARRMLDIEVIVKRGGSTILIQMPKKAAKPTLHGRPRLSLKPSRPS